jgi:inosine-uridine nucleoside N-ribohydrolase
MLPLLALLFAPVNPVIIDTDAGTDDLLAIAYLLSRPDVEIEAITVVSGVAHVHPGAINILRLLDAAGRSNVKVYEGVLTNPHPFPEEWRKPADDLAGVALPPASRKPESRSAVDFLRERIQRPCRILALGPLANLAAVLGPRNAISQLVVMGGAVRVPGNVEAQPDSEWNIYADPAAARKVFDSGIPIELIPLDATNHVPIDAAYLTRFEREATSPIGKIAAQILATSKSLVDTHIFYAWDPLAAVALANPETVTTQRLRIRISDTGRTQETPGAPNVSAAIDANPAQFEKHFLQAFRSAAK